MVTWDAALTDVEWFSVSGGFMVIHSVTPVAHGTIPKTHQRIGLSRRRNK